MSALKVGDEVMLCSVNHKARKTRVARVGRKYIRVEGDERGDYCIESLRRLDVYQHEYLVTMDDYARGALVSEAVEKLRALGIGLDFDKKSQDRAPEILAAVLPVLTPTREADGK